MLKLRDFFHLPEVDDCVKQLCDDEPGLIVVAGLDSHPLPLSGATPLSGGRSTLFRILTREILDAMPSSRAALVTADQAAARLARHPRLDVFLVQHRHTATERITAAIHSRPALLVVDHLDGETIGPALKAAQEGIRVLAQLDTPLRGPHLARQLQDLGAPRDRLHVLNWVIAVQRVATLCGHCKVSVAFDDPLLTQLQQRFQNFTPSPADQFYQAGSCENCNHTGRHGDVIAFDIYHRGRAVLPMEYYLQRLAQLGHVALDDLLEFETDQIQHLYHLFLSAENVLDETQAALERKQLELDTAHHVLQQRTKALVSFQGFGQTLIGSTELSDLAAQICRYVHELCGADRAILYFLRSEEWAEILAVYGWEPSLLHQQVEAEVVFEAHQGADPIPFGRWPPGVPMRPPEVEGVYLRAGLYVPLFAQERRVGLMIVHSTVRYRFEPGEVALLETFAAQAALAIQRADLIAQLRTKIALLEAAQVELARKERLERDLELARQVQQNVLPRTFPAIPGVQFAAHYESARQVGGDFYDVVRLDEDHFGLAVADVSDKGLPAALYMALTRSLLLAEARRDLSPRAVLCSVNQLLLELGEQNMFVTVFYGVVDQTTREFTYARAGHDRPILLRDGSARELDGKGMALGLMDQSALRLSEEQIALAPGDCLVLYTDGLTDVADEQGVQFGLARFTALLHTYANRPPADLCAGVFDDLARYRGRADPFDDMTLLVVGIE